MGAWVLRVVGFGEDGVGEVVWLVHEVYLN